MTMWMVRAGEGGDQVDAFRSKGVVGFGGTKLGKVPADISKAALLAIYEEKYPEAKEGSRASWASQLLRLMNEVQIGDAVATYDPEQRIYLLGKVTSGLEWDPSGQAILPHVRHVQWGGQVARGALSVAARNSLGAIQTVFKVPPEVADEMEKLRAPLGKVETPVPGPSPVEGGVENELDKLRLEVIQKADEFIEDAISKLDPYDMQELVAGILRAMGYRTTVSPPGSDRGVDITASPDGLLLQEPRIFVEVKHRTGSTMGSKEIRAFLGGRKAGDRCLYVSTGGFTKDAHYEADRSPTPITLINLSTLRRLLVDNYDRLDPETRAMVPLRKFFWPVVED